MWDKSKNTIAPRFSSHFLNFRHKEQTDGVGLEKHWIHQLHFPAPRGLNIIDLTSTLCGQVTAHADDFQTPHPHFTFTFISEHHGCQCPRPAF